MIKLYTKFWDLEFFIFKKFIVISRITGNHSKIDAGNTSSKTCENGTSMQRNPLLNENVSWFHRKWVNSFVGVYETAIT